MARIARIGLLLVIAVGCSKKKSEPKPDPTKEETPAAVVEEAPAGSTWRGKSNVYSAKIEGTSAGEGTLTLTVTKDDALEWKTSLGNEVVIVEATPGDTPLQWLYHLSSEAIGKEGKGADGKERPHLSRLMMAAAMSYAGQWTALDEKHETFKDVKSEKVKHGDHEDIHLTATVIESGTKFDVTYEDATMLSFRDVTMEDDKGRVVLHLTP